MRIEADNITMTIDGRAIFNGVSLACEGGTMTALVGPSGSGKTTLLHCLGLLQKPSGGRITIDGTDTSGWGSAGRRRFWRESASFVLQDYGVMEDESVAFNVAMTAGLLGGRVIADTKRLSEALEATGLGGRDTELASHLSGGEKQRLAVARAIYKNASAVFVDEPTASLDAANRTHVIQLFSSLAKRGCLVVVATHDDEMMSACNVRYVVNASRDTAKTGDAA
jgi:putative ABC transport system ATP-binding protein